MTDEIKPQYLRKLADDLEDMGMIETAADLELAARRIESLEKTVTDHAFEIVRLRDARNAWQTTALDNGADLDQQAGINLQLREEITQLRDKRI